jgi:hypothetical protein
MMHGIINCRGEQIFMDDSQHRLCAARYALLAEVPDS